MPNLQNSSYNSGSDGRTLERRTSTRLAVEIPVEIRIAPPAGRDTEAYSLRNPFRPGTIKDISTGGIYVTSGIRVAEASVIEMRLTHEGRVYPFKAIVRHTELDVVSARPTMGMGAQILRDDNSEAVLPLLIEIAMRGHGTQRP